MTPAAPDMMSRFSALSRLRARFSREDWNIGIVDQPAEDIVRHGITAPVRWLPRIGPWGMLADPAFCRLADGTQIIMAEHMNHWISRGEIWKAEMPEGQALHQAELRPWIRMKGHLSYPFPVQDVDGRLCLMVESWETARLHLWHQTEGGFSLVGPILDRPVIDATPWRDDTGWWLFCTHDDGPNERLHIYHSARLEGPWTPHSANPVKIDAGSARPAGPLFRAGGKLIRPSQDCSSTYGGAVVLSEITRLDRDGFREERVRRLEPEPGYPNGLHTICPAGDVTIIDGKRWAFQAMDLPRKVVAALNNRRRRLQQAGTVPQWLDFPFPTAAPQQGDGSGHHRQDGVIANARPGSG